MEVKGRKSPLLFETVIDSISSLGNRSVNLSCALMLFTIQYPIWFVYKKNDAVVLADWLILNKSIQDLVLDRCRKNQLIIVFKNGEYIPGNATFEPFFFDYAEIWLELLMDSSRGD